MAPSLLGRSLLAMSRARAAVRRRMATSYFRATVGAFDARSDVDFDVDIRTPEQVSLGRNTVIKRGVILNGRSATRSFGLSFGPETYIKEHCYLDAYGGFIETAGPCAIAQFSVFHGGGGITIGRYVMFGAHCYVIASNHVFDSLDLPYILQGDNAKGIVIEDNVWIGGGAIILDGVTVGRNSVVGAGAIVAKDVPANSIYVDRAPRLLAARLHRKDRPRP